MRLEEFLLDRAEKKGVKQEIELGALENTISVIKKLLKIQTILFKK